MYFKALWEESHHECIKRKDMHLSCFSETPFIKDTQYFIAWGLPGGVMEKNLPANAGGARDEGWIIWVGKILWWRKWQSTPVFLPRKFHRQRGLVGQFTGSQRVDMIEHIQHIFEHIEVYINVLPTFRLNCAIKMKASKLYTWLQGKTTPSGVRIFLWWYFR